MLINQNERMLKVDHTQLRKERMAALKEMDRKQQLYVEFLLRAVAAEGIRQSRIAADSGSLEEYCRALQGIARASGRHQETQHYIALLREQARAANGESGETLQNDLTHKQAVGLLLGLFQIAVDLDTQDERQQMQRVACHMAEVLGLAPETPGEYG